MLKISGKEGRPYSLMFRGVSFSIPYEVGVFSALRNLSPDILKSASRIYGSSSGSIVATVGLCGCDMETVMEYGFGHVKTSVLGLIPGGRVPRHLRHVLNKFLPPNAHELVSGKLHIVLTRLHDWRSVTVSEFASREELIQAVVCSCFIPLYFGLSPPTFRGVRYLDGELAMWRADLVSRSTITISAFAGEYDICPKEGSAAFLTFQLSDAILQISKMNMCRLLHVFYPFTHQVMNQFYIQGYQDTISFLKRLSDFQVNYFEGFTLSIAKELNQSTEETLHPKPPLKVLHSTAKDHGDDTKENPGISQAADKEE